MQGQSRNESHHPRSASIGGRLAVDFVNIAPSGGPLSWNDLVLFLEAVRIVSPERGAQLLSLPHSDAQSAEALLTRANRLRRGLRASFQASVARERILREWVEPVNEILRITEGHDELTFDGSSWRLEFVAQEGGLDWLLAAIARSAAEILVEGARARLRVCANPACGLYFCDASRTGRRRWCSMAVCGNRHKVAAFSRRHSARSRQA